MTPEEFRSLLDRSQVIAEDAFGPKVLLTGDQRIVKIFRRKRILSRALILPSGKRFAKNAQILKKRGIDTVTIEDYRRCSCPPRELVWYRYLMGNPLREVCQNSKTEEIAMTVEKLGAFVAVLHRRGVLFRSLHWNNILLQPSGRFALIDILDLRVRNKPLNNSQRRRNFRHLLGRYQEDTQTFQLHSEKFWKGYAAATELSEKQLKCLKRLEFLE